MLDATQYMQKKICNQLPVKTIYAEVCLRRKGTNTTTTVMKYYPQIYLEEMFVHGK